MSNAAIFFDRDGTLIHDPGYLNHPDQVQLLDGAAEALRELRGLSYKTVVVSNQSGVARGIVTEEMLERIHERLRDLLSTKGASLDKVYYCPYHPDGVIDQYRKDSDWRKPKPGMLLAAAKEMDIDLTKSWMIGDNERDVEAGRTAGCRTILIRASRSESGTTPPCHADHVAVNMREAVNIVKQHHRSGGQNPAAPVPSASHDDTLAAQSMEILSMVEEYAAKDAERQSAGPATTGAKTDQLLAGILEQLRRMQKTEMFVAEFSLLRLLAGIVQVFVTFCLLLALWFLMGPHRQDNNAFVALGFGAVLQMMALTFYMMPR
ncbi:MAG TPA: HAD family hydrolase [Sedimentisphaerales bacterium]|jgi:D-glycero-D-manno-heptose 1,7-bisphosphate phosphatase|nr:HAD family hydrolase [Sedimentisphaerales bacterium]HNU29621.1 HAD family hydrolase [Sedimentisphaerales bacterium]